jgi:hypothetical protein
LSKIAENYDHNIDPWSLEKKTGQILVYVRFPKMMLGLLVGSIVGGRLGDRLGRKPATFGALLLCVPTVAAGGVSANYVAYAALRFVSGDTYSSVRSLVHMCINTYVCYIVIQSFALHER